MAGGSVEVPLAAIRVQVRAQAHARTLRFGNRVLNTARRSAPVDTGQLRSSGTVTSTEETVSVIFSTEYASYVHDGTIYQDGQPFVTDAYQEERARGI